MPYVNSLGPHFEVFFDQDGRSRAMTVVYVGADGQRAFVDSVEFDHTVSERDICDQLWEMLVSASLSPFE